MVPAAAPAPVGASLRSPMRLTGCCCRWILLLLCQSRHSRRPGPQKDNNCSTTKELLLWGGASLRSPCVLRRRSPLAMGGEPPSFRAFRASGFRDFRASGLPGFGLRAPAAFDDNVFKAITALHTGTGTGTVGTDVSRGTKKQAINNLETNPAAAAGSTVPARVGCPG